MWVRYARIQTPRDPFAGWAWRQEHLYTISLGCCAMLKLPWGRMRAASGQREIVITVSNVSLTFFHTHPTILPVTLV